jgi:hypothetical protein
MVRTADTKPSRTVIISITSSTDGSITHMAIIATTTGLCSWSEIDTTALRAVRKSSVHAERLAAHGLQHEGIMKRRMGRRFGCLRLEVLAAHRWLFRATDTDGNREDRSDTVSVFNGPPPTIHSLKSEGEETTLVGNWIAERAKAGVRPPPQSRR